LIWEGKKRGGGEFTNNNRTREKFSRGGEKENTAVTCEGGGDGI